MMREAAYMAGLTSDAPGITRFTPVGSPLPRPEEVNPQKLSLALEPEVAAIAAQHQSEVKGLPPQRYMVVDIGGGTVDITVHDKSNGRISVVLPPMGNTWGGTTINEALSEKLQEAVNDKDFKVLLESDPISAKATLNRIFYEKFEEQKKIFGNVTQGLRRVALSLPRAFTRHYGNNIPQKPKKMNMHYNPENESLTIGYDLLEEVFQSTINKILVCVRAAFDEIKPIGVDTVYLVGGFGGCKFVSQKIQGSIAQHRNMLYDNIVCPVQPDLAVVSGAVMWRKDPNIIQSRVADATYGVAVAPVFNPSKHDKHYKFVDEDGVVRCDCAFEVFVLKGEEIKDEVHKATFIPLQRKKTQAHIPIYCTIDDGVQYVIDKEGKPTVREIGKLVLDIPNPDNVPNKERKYDVSMDFSGTEIQARAQYSITGEEVKTVCDFLSKQD
ncbi:PREDICTED: heat shock 70 kDa protein 12B-like [Amphimedon queenslandica]|nr:PREDICTED: heat shock 70 kDa protein 12B-like [Amphimedon queenslandica]|eukprot:XP_019861153.1 PREDICTED: heat shock 70 kDa protein 12B-like [Amphimedon queenslandica]